MWTDEGIWQMATIAGRLRPSAAALAAHLLGDGSGYAWEASTRRRVQVMLSQFGDVALTADDQQAMEAYRTAGTEQSTYACLPSGKRLDLASAMDFLSALDCVFIAQRSAAALDGLLAASDLPPH